MACRSLIRHSVACYSVSWHLVLCHAVVCHVHLHWPVSLTRQRWDVKQNGQVFLCCHEWPFTWSHLHLQINIQSSLEDKNPPLLCLSREYLSTGQPVRAVHNVVSYGLWLSRPNRWPCSYKAKDPPGISGQPKAGAQTRRDERVREKGSCLQINYLPPQ